MVECKDTLGRTIPAYVFIGHKSNRIATIMVNLSSLMVKKILIITLTVILQVVMYSMVQLLLSGVDCVIYYPLKSQTHLQAQLPNALAQIILFNNLTNIKNVIQKKFGDLILKENIFVLSLENHLTTQNQSTMFSISVI